MDALALMETLTTCGVKLRVATSVRRAGWEAAEVYPVARNPLRLRGRILLALLVTAAVVTGFAAALRFLG